ncbi:hypothetical protein [Roseateles sp. BYS87W]|uniref:Uncharacterized protein n=1 Tax=Pelomonas baiyunensis TaxID=3299026 RepID=A0ABW7H4R3_9BURK
MSGTLWKTRGESSHWHGRRVALQPAGCGNPCARHASTRHAGADLGRHGRGGGPIPPVVMLVERRAFMPQARVEGDRGEALARRLGRDLIARPVPRKCLAEALRRGEGDLACDDQPEWLRGAVAWSRPFLPDQAWLMTAADAPAPPHLLSLAGPPVGTVRGWVGPEVGDVLRSGVQRDAAPDAMANLQKRARGRVQHALTGRRVLEYTQPSANACGPCTRRGWCRRCWRSAPCHATAA